MPDAARSSTPPHPSRSAAEFDRRARKLERLSAHWAGRLQRARNLRLGSGVFFAILLAICTAFPFLRGEVWVVTIFLLEFIPLVVRTRRLQAWNERLKGLASYYERQRDRAVGETPRLPELVERDEGADERIVALSGDLALDGPRSLRAWLDETATDGGRRALLRRLSADPGTAAEARARQSNVRSLARLRWPLLRARLVGESAALRLSTYELLRLAEQPLLPASAARQAALCAGVWVVSAIAIGFVLAGALPGGWAPLAIVAFAVTSHWTLQGWGPVFLRGEGLSHHGQELARVWTALERLAATQARAASLLPELARAPMSRDLRRLDRALAAASVESHPLAHILINALLPWSVFADLWLERARRAIAARAPAVVAETHEFEAWTSLALYAAEHGGAWPEFRDEPVLDVDDLVHPLLPATQAVGNSLRLAKDDAQASATALLTGSNMAGKSTFLRALGCNQLLANAGAPVRAARYVCAPLAVETCVQIADSLADGVSYFYAEVLRLRSVLDAATGAARRPALVLIDEIFRGTNNRERLAGSKAVIRKLAASGALTVVSTHDLELTTLAPEGVGNWHFRDDVRDGRLSFDYKLRPGPCPTTNALRIMRDAGLPVPE